MDKVVSLIDKERCEYCGEDRKGDEPMALLYKVSEEGDPLYVHGEECAQVLREKGYEIA